MGIPLDDLQRARLERECERFLQVLKGKPQHAARHRAILEHEAEVAKILEQSVPVDLSDEG